LVYALKALVYALKALIYKFKTLVYTLKAFIYALLTSVNSSVDLFTHSTAKIANFFAHNGTDQAKLFVCQF